MIFSFAHFRLSHRLLALGLVQIQQGKIFIIFLQEIFPAGEDISSRARYSWFLFKKYYLQDIHNISLWNISHHRWTVPDVATLWRCCGISSKTICKIFIIFLQEIFICLLIFCVSHWCPVNWALCHFRRLLWLPLQPRAQFTATGVPLTLERGKKNFVSSNVWSKKQNEMVSHFVHIQRHVSRLEYYGRAAHAERGKKKKNWRNVENRQN